MLVLLLLVALDVVTGMASAIKRGQWLWSAVADWLTRDFIGYYVCAGVFTVIITAMPQLASGAPIGPGVAAIALLASIGQNLRELGVTPPDPAPAQSVAPPPPPVA